jgi:hypothetical protein
LMPSPIQLFAKKKNPKHVGAPPIEQHQQN